MLENIPLDAILAKGGPVSLLVLVVVMILTGRLVPRATFQDKVEEAKEWKAVALAATEQSKELLEYARTADAILRSLPRGGGHE